MSGKEINFGLRISAIDATQAGLRSAYSGIAKLTRLAAKPITVPLQIGRGTLGLLRDVNQGLMPLVRGIDSLVSRGTRLDAVSQSFKSLTQTVSGGRLAEQIQLAAQGTIRLAEGMQIANRALASGLGFDQLLTAVEFISKKSATTGKDAGQALDTVITGLARGSTLFLDDFGILVDGAAGVARSFDAIKGAGAFEQLGPAAQKAETVRQAIAEMQQQMGRIGVTGRETTFAFARMKSELGDAVDKLAAAAGRSQALRTAVTGARDMVVGLREHFEKGGSLGDVIFGKGGRGGLAGLASAGLKDIGANVGAGLKGAMLEGALLLVNAIDSGLSAISFKKFGEQFADGITGKLKSAGGWIGSLFGESGSSAASQPAASRPAASQPAASGVSDAMARAAARGEIATVGFGQFGSNFGEVAKGEAIRVGVGAGVAAVSRATLKEIASTDKTALAAQARDSMGRYIPRLAGDVASAGVPSPGFGVRAARGAMAVGAKASGILAVADFAYSTYQLIDEVLLLRDAMAALREAEEHLVNQRRRLAAQQASVPLGMVLPAGLLAQANALSGFGSGGGALDSIKNALAKAIAENKAPGFAGVAAAAQAVQEQFGAPGGETRADRKARRASEVKKLEGLLPLTDAERRKRQGEYAAKVEELSSIKTSEKTRREAMRLTREEVDGLRGQGRVVSQAERNRLYRINFEKIEAERRQPIMDRIRVLSGELVEDRDSHTKGRDIKRLRREQAGEDLSEFAERIEAAVKQSIQATQDVISAIMGGSAILKARIG